VLLLVLAAFGCGASGFAVARFTQVIVCASADKRTEPHRVSQPRTSTTSPLPVRLIVPHREQRLPFFFICRWLFQRPPPVILLSHA
jgi:hypothetical protein